MRFGISKHVINAKTDRRLTVRSHERLCLDGQADGLTDHACSLELQASKYVIGSLNWIWS